MSPVSNALIIGGGIGGMATAIKLRQMGVAVDLIDIDPDWKVYGAGLTITAPTLRAFRDLGLYEAIGQHGFFAAGQLMFLYDGTFLGEQTPPPIEPGLPVSGGIMRPRLHQIMSSEVRKLDVDVRLGIEVLSLDQTPSSVTVEFSDGSRRAYDLVVAADGIYSKTRASLFPDAARPAYTGQMSWRVVAPRPATLDKAEFFFGHTHIGGIIPCSNDEVYAFILHPDPDNRRVPIAEQPDRLRELMADFGGSMAVIRDGIGKHSSILARPFEYAFQPRPWHIGRVVLIGDAAHATTPHLASGAGIAVEDALVLGQELEKATDVPAALQAFTDRRFERCRFVIESSVAIGSRQLEGATPEEVGMLMGRAMGFLAGAI